MATVEGGPSARAAGGSTRKGIELEKYKRRLIRSVARRLKEKKPDMWEEMKKEIGSNCKKLWERMRMLTLKKLQRLLQADDRVDLIGPVARMTITDWLLFDLVIVHEKIDVIERGKLMGEYNSKVLSNLFALVQRFEIEGKSGDDLAEAWTAATVYYNSKGHQCSPMMLQRRWFQIKELTRHKFYKFWFNYRGNLTNLTTAMTDSPDALQKAIALRYPTVITDKFLSWEEGIDNRLVILPEELGVKMRKMIAVKPTDTTAPDVVLIEPQIEVIDLGTNSDSGDEEVENTNSKTLQPPLVKIKDEPIDADEEFEEEHEVYYPPEKGIEFDEEIERLEKAEENLDEDIVPENIVEKAQEVVIDPVPSVYDTEADSPSNEVEIGNENDDGESELNFETNDDIHNVETNTDAIVIDDEDEPCVEGDNATVNVEQVDSSVISNDKESLEKKSHLDETTDSHMNEASNDSSAVIAEITSIASAGIKVENLDDVIEKVNTPSNDPMTGYDLDEQLPVISTVSSVGVKVERNSSVLDNTADSDMPTNNGEPIDNDMSADNDIEIIESNAIENPDKIDEITGDLPVISTVSSKGVKVEIETENIEENLQTEDPSRDTGQHSYFDDVIDNDTVNKSIESPVLNKNSEKVIDLNKISDDDIVNKTTESPVVIEDSAKAIDLEEFRDIHMDLNFADEGIEFADDGIVYVEDDEDDIITVKDPRAEEESVKIGDNKEASIEKEEETQKFDLKLLMYPVVYTTKLDDMSVFDVPSLYEQVYNKESIDKIHSLSKPVSNRSVTMSEHAIIQDQTDGKNEPLENNDAVNLSDDDLFRNESIEESNDSDSEPEVIDDSKRVKLTSYMLQKPRHRSYNPVLLCKNPDFNTRLKKLPVGFFMSARNRTLLQSCIPMTIDMSKAFEDKLIDGSLYLKLSPNDKTETINLADNVETKSAALVKPFTVQQSLMSIDDTLEKELKKCMAERVRGINLPDISQVRRLNQHLLTAEVTPQRLQNETLPDINKQSTTIVNSDLYVQNIKDDINNLLSQQKETDDTNTDTHINSVFPESQPCPPPVEVNNPVTIAQPPPPMVSINNPVPEVQSTYMPPQLESNKSAPSKHQNPTNDTNVATTSGLPKVRKPPRRTIYPTLAWNKRPVARNQTNQDIHQSDALLTIDTLYKMLNALDPCTKFKEALPKKKKKKKVVETKPIEDAPTQVIDITDDEVPPKKAKGRPRCKAIRTKDAEFCCWCSYRIDSVRSNKPDIVTRRHRCKANRCVCCCKALYYDGDLGTVAAAAQSIELIEKEQHVSQTIEHVVQLLNPMQMVKPTSDVSIQIDLDDDTQVEPVSDPSPSNTAVLLKTTDATLEVYDTTLDTSKDGSAELTPLLPSPCKQPTPRFRVYSSGSMLSISSTSNTAESSPVARNTAASNTAANNTAASNTAASNTAASNTGASNIRPNINFMPLAKDKPVQNYKESKPSSVISNTCTCTRPTISRVNKGKIEINGKNNCPIHKKRKKEGKKIFFTKKVIANESQPFFVGKGKILLTNIKMPNTKNDPIVIAPNDLPTTPASPISESALVQPITLPVGIQIVLLPDQTLTYITQPDVTLTPEECALLPQFLAAIMQEINAVGITLPADHPIAKMDVVIDVDKDESSNKSENKEIAKPITQEQFDKEIATSENITEENEDFEKSIDSIQLASKKKFSEITSAAIKIGTPNNPDVKTNNAGKIGIPKNPEIETGQIGIPKNLEVETNNASAVEKTDVSDKDVSFESNNAKSSHADEATNKKSLLSDLMEMSGIMEEDLAPSQVPPPQEPILLDTQNFVLHKEVPRETAVTQTYGSSLSLTSTQQYTAKNKNGNFELMAVTSFAELKYSCDNNGIFFKLDLESGHLTSINVCIQKLQTKAALPSDEKSVIDLTDDPDISITGSTDDSEDLSIVNQHSLVTLNETNEQSPTHHKLQIATILQKKQRLMERLSNNLKPVNILQSKKHVARILKRNQFLNRDPQFTFYSKRKLDKIEAKIDLVDSDAPMEEEYLLSDDSSDDEPLIKKVKRKHLKNASGPSSDTELDKRAEKLILNKPLLKTRSLLSQLQPTRTEVLKDSNGQVQQQFDAEDHSSESEKIKLNVRENLGKPKNNDIQEKIGEENQLNEEHSDEETLEEQSLDEQLLDEREDEFVDEEDEEMNDIRQTIANMRPVPTNLVLSGGALNVHNIPLNTNFRADGDDTQDEDCILGV